MLSPIKKLLPTIKGLMGNGQTYRTGVRNARASRLGSRVICFCVLCHGVRALANPEGMTVSQGAATAVANGNNLTVTASHGALLNWQSFNINAGQSTTFVQPNSHSMVFNQINDASPSQIFGSIYANGNVVLMNQSGFYFGPDAFVKAAGFVATTGHYTPDFTGGASWEFNGSAPTAKIINYGKINVDQGGSLFLIGGEINNHGTLSAPGGKIGLCDGQQVILSDRPDGTGINVQVKLPTGSVNNDGQIIADGGKIIANAQVVNQNGLVQANTVREVNGEIELVASDAIALGSGSVIKAEGDDHPVSSGGKVTIQSGNTFSDTTGSMISAAGGLHGGNGGAIEVSAPNVLSLDSTLGAGAAQGYQSGSFLLDPGTINIGTTTANGTLNGSGTVLSTATPATMNLNINSSFKNFSAITLQSTGDINLNNPWALNTSTLKASGTLKLEAGGNINFKDGSSITDSGNWVVSLFAGVANFNTLALKTTGNIYLNGGNQKTGSGYIDLNGGALSLTAGKDIQTDSGMLHSVSGGITLNSGGNVTIGGGSVTSDNASVAMTSGGNMSIGGGFVSALNGSLTLKSTGSLTTGNGELIAGAGGISLTSGATIAIGGGYNDGVTPGYLSVGTTSGGAINLTAAGDFDNIGDISAVGGGALKVISSGGAITANHLLTDSGDLTVEASSDVTVGHGPGQGGILTTAGGNISVTSDNGSVDSHYSTGGYTFSSLTKATVDPTVLGGISTAAGGNVTINALQNVISYLPGSSSGDATDSGSGAFAGGDVTVTAGGSVFGHFVVSNGKGMIKATGGDAGTQNDALALSLAKGSWVVNAAGNIYLQEARNPNGIYNRQDPSSSTYHYFDYADDASLSLTAKSVELGNSSLPRNSGEGSIPAIYPPMLTINAGAGGIRLDNSMLLFPSAKGSLDIETTGGGNFVSGASSSSSLPSITMSDSGSKQIIGMSDTALKSAFSDHAAVPVHLGSETLCKVDISGEMDNISLNLPEPGTIHVHKDLNNSAFIGQNLKGNDVTSITVDGKIFNANEYTTTVLPLSSAPNLDLLLQSAGNTDYSSLFNLLSYNPATKELTVHGSLSADDIKNGLLNLVIQQTGPNGQPLFNQDGSKVLTTVSIFDKNDPNYSQLSTLTGSAGPGTLDTWQVSSLSAATSKGPGYALGGPGQFKITAANVDLGDTFGIQSVGPLFNPSLALHAYSDNDPKNVGASINLTVLGGDLTMFNSQVSTLAGGDVTINALGGKITAGSLVVPASDTSPRGIYTVAKGNVTVIAGKDISLDGSRLAAFDGGTIFVKSLTGNINAGSGGSTGAQITEVVLVPILDAMGNQVVDIDPLTSLPRKDYLGNPIKQYLIKQYNPVIPGSGIIASTFPPPISGVDFPPSTRQVGNVTVLTPQGDIIASEGGVKQLSFDGVPLGNATVTLTAGTLPDKDGMGNDIPGTGYKGSILANGAGVIGANVALNASGDIQGFVIAQGNLNVTAVQNVVVTAVATGTASVNSSGSVSGLVIGVGGINASGSSIEASLFSAAGINASGGNGSSGSQSSGSGNVAAATSAAASNDDHGKAAAVANDNATSDDERKKKNLPGLTKTGRVTVILPGKS